MLNGIAIFSSWNPCCLVQKSNSMLKTTVFYLLFHDFSWLSHYFWYQNTSPFHQTLPMDPNTVWEGTNQPPNYSKFYTPVPLPKKVRLDPSSPIKDQPLTSRCSVMLRRFQPRRLGVRLFLLSPWWPGHHYRALAPKMGKNTTEMMRR